MGSCAQLVKTNEQNYFSVFLPVPVYAFIVIHTLVFYVIVTIFKYYDLLP